MLIYATEEDLQFRKDLGVATKAHGITEVYDGEPIELSSRPIHKPSSEHGFTYSTVRVSIYR